MRLLATIAAALLVLGACTTDTDDAASPTAQAGSPTVEPTPAGTPDPLRLDSPVLVHGEPMPAEFSCDGENVSPPLAWSGVPEGTVELALLMTDPDAGEDGFVHWVLYGIDPRETELARGSVPPSAVEGVNGADEPGYRGPCPPPPEDPHTYVFTLWALDTDSRLEPGATADELRGAVEGKVVAEGVLEATYDR